MVTNLPYLTASNNLVRSKFVAESLVVNDSCEWHVGDLHTVGFTNIGDPLKWLLQTACIKRSKIEKSLTGCIFCMCHYSSNPTAFLQQIMEF